MAPIFQPIKITEDKLSSTVITNGAAYFVQDTQKLFFDYGNIRTEITDIIVMDHEADRQELLAPLNKFYFIIDTGAIWYYRLGTWIQVSGGAEIEVKTQVFTAGANIASVVLDDQAGYILSVNVDNEVLLESNYTLGQDKQTITFASAITAELSIEVKYFTSLGALAAGSSIEFGPATTSTLGLVKIGDRLSITAAGVLSADVPAMATNSAAGIVQPDNDTLKIVNSKLEATKATSNQFGVVKVDGVSIKVDQNSGAIYTDGVVPSNMVTTDTDQLISGIKSFTQANITTGTITTATITTLNGGTPALTSDISSAVSSINSSLSSKANTSDIDGAWQIFDEPIVLKQSASSEDLSTASTILLSEVLPAGSDTYELDLNLFMTTEVDSTNQAQDFRVYSSISPDVAQISVNYPCTSCSSQARIFVGSDKTLHIKTGYAVNSSVTVKLLGYRKTSVNIVATQEENEN